MTLTGFESLRDDRREVTLPTEPFDTSASDARFSTTTLAVAHGTTLLATEASVFGASMSAIAAFVCSRGAKPRGARL